MTGPEHDPLEIRLRELAGDYNEPPPPPREAIWQAIAESRGRAADDRDSREHDDLTSRRRRKGLRLIGSRPLRLGAGIAALLVLGISVGRFTAPTRDATPTRAATPSSAVTAGASSDEALRVTAGRHLAQSETFLTLFRVSVRAGRPDEAATGTARELLLSNRLLLDSPAADDADLRRLLEDLELVLAQIAQLPGEGARGDARLITDGMEAGSMLPRLRSVTSDVASPTLRQGAL